MAKKSYFHATTTNGDYLFHMNEYKQHNTVHRWSMLSTAIQEKILDKFKRTEYDPSEFVAPCIISLGLVQLGEQWEEQQKNGQPLTAVTGRV